jgi:hypothetical protein
MTTGTLMEFILEGTKMEITNCYMFLGSIITRDGHDYKEINRRLSIGRMAMTKLEKIMKDQDVMKATKIKIAETVIFPTVDREENEPFSFGGSETQKITRSNNPPIKVMLLWPHYESERDTGAGHYAWTSRRIQEAGKTMNVMA